VGWNGINPIVVELDVLDVDEGDVSTTPVSVVIDMVFF